MNSDKTPASSNAVLPLVLVYVFQRSELTTREWIGAGLDLDLELSVQAKAMLLARESGLELPITSDRHDSFQEIEYLRASIGRTGLLALKPVVRKDARTLWQVFLLEAAKRNGGG